MKLEIYQSNFYVAQNLAKDGRSRTLKRRQHREKKRKCLGLTCIQIIGSVL